MQEKYAYGLWAAAVGAIALTVVGFAWGVGPAQPEQQSGGGGLNCVPPICAKDVMADPEAVAELKMKRPVDYDDVVRDYRKRTGKLTNLSYRFNRDCGKAM